MTYNTFYIQKMNILNQNKKYIEQKFSKKRAYCDSELDHLKLVTSHKLFNNIFFVLIRM